MKIIIFTLLFIGYSVCRSQDTIRYAINKKADTRLIKIGDSVSISLLPKEKNFQYRVVNVKLSFKRYDMKMLKTIKDTVINFPLKFNKNAIVFFKPGSFPIFKQAEALTITVGEIMKKNKKGETESVSNVLGREKELQVAK
jgi:hypothetical protein